jgi:hypothetical protein
MTDDDTAKAKLNDGRLAVEFNEPRPSLVLDWDLLPGDYVSGEPEEIFTGDRAVREAAAELIRRRQQQK